MDSRKRATKPAERTQRGYILKREWSTCLTAASRANRAAGAMQQKIQIHQAAKQQIDDTAHPGPARPAATRRASCLDLPTSRERGTGTEGMARAAKAANSIRISNSQMQRCRHWEDRRRGPGRRGGGDPCLRAARLVILTPGGIGEPEVACEAQEPCAEPGAGAASELSSQNEAGRKERIRKRGDGLIGQGVGPPRWRIKLCL
mmetsp:Transcript_33278/g.81700  ORF Transcript_33278/g.81700 Transcript_33278/m.81700 type:complete len:203 (-) Transcript_33278:23-631(-)